jgi:DNA (cytosine-5)-methyltransferase 1
MLTVGSLFSGIGGLDLGLERAGFKTAWQVEADPFRAAVLKKHWPDIPRWADIQEVDFATVPRVDVLAGGFPCQNVSSAGDGTGLAGARSGLWREFSRAIRLVRPRVAIVENVAALLAAGRGMGEVLGDLAESRYDAEWDCIPACSVGAPHERDRVFIVAHAHREGREDELRPEAPGVPAPERARGERPAADPDGARQLQPEGRQREGWGRPSHSAWWGTEPDVVRVVHGLPRGVDRGVRVEGLGLAVVPQVAEHVGGIARLAAPSVPKEVDK